MNGHGGCGTSLPLAAEEPGMAPNLRLGFMDVEAARESRPSSARSVRVSDWPGLRLRLLKPDAT
jgi:hypothetical protein